MTDERLAEVLTWLHDMMPTVVLCIKFGAPEMAVKMLRAASELINVEFVQLADGDQLNQLRMRIKDEVRALANQIITPSHGGH